MKNIERKEIYVVDVESTWTPRGEDADMYEEGVSSEFFNTFEEAFAYVEKNLSKVCNFYRGVVNGDFVDIELEYDLDVVRYRKEREEFENG